MPDKRFWILDFGFWIRRNTLHGARKCVIPAIQNRQSPRAKRISRHKIQNRHRGFTLLEIIIVITILSILTAAAIPMVRNSIKRQREEDLRLALRQIRQAIDRYREFYDRNPGAIPLEMQTGEAKLSHCPPSLEILAEGFIPAGVIGTNSAKIRFLRKVPEDPMTGSTEWGLRSYKDEATSTSWGGGDVFDVYSKSDGTALNETKYKDW